MGTERRPAHHPALRRRIGRHVSAMSPAAARRSPKETLDVSADGRTGRLDNFQRVTVVGRQGQERAPRAVRSGQGTEGAARAVRRCGPDRVRRCRSRWTRWSRRLARRWRSSAASPPECRCRCERSRPRLVRPPAAVDVALGDRPPHGGRGPATAWRSRQVRPGDVVRPLRGTRPERDFVVTAARCRPRAAGPRPDRPGSGHRGGRRGRPGAGRAPGRCSASPAPTAPTPTGSPTRSPGGVHRTRSWRSGSTTATSPRPATSSRSGRCPGITT